MSHLLIRHLLFGYLLQRVNPRVAHAVAELFLLSPCHSLRQHVGERLAHDFLLYGFTRTHLCLGVGAHSHVKKFLVEEGHTSLNAPCRQTLVGTQAVVQMQLGQLAYGLLVESACVGSLVEVQIATEYLVGTLAREHHLYAHRLYYTCQQIHRC